MLTGWLMAVVFVVSVICCPLTVSVMTVLRTWCYLGLPARQLFVLGAQALALSPNLFRLYVNESL